MRRLFVPWETRRFTLFENLVCIPAWLKFHERCRISSGSGLAQLPVRGLWHDGPLTDALLALPAGFAGLCPVEEIDGGSKGVDHHAGLEQRAEHPGVQGPPK